MTKCEKPDCIRLMENYAYKRDKTIPMLRQYAEYLKSTSECEGMCGVFIRVMNGEYGGINTN